MRLLPLLQPAAPSSLYSVLATPEPPTSLALNVTNTALELQPAGAASLVTGAVVSMRTVAVRSASSVAGRVEGAVHERVDSVAGDSDARAGAPGAGAVELVLGLGDAGAARIGRRQSDRHRVVAPAGGRVVSRQRRRGVDPHRHRLVRLDVPCGVRGAIRKRVDAIADSNARADAPARGAVQLVLRLRDTGAAGIARGQRHRYARRGPAGGSVVRGRRSGRVDADGGGLARLDVTGHVGGVVTERVHALPGNGHAGTCAKGCGAVQLVLGLGHTGAAGIGRAQGDRHRTVAPARGSVVSRDRRGAVDPDGRGLVGLDVPRPRRWSGTRACARLTGDRDARADAPSCGTVQLVLGLRHAGAPRRSRSA